MCIAHVYIVKVSIILYNLIMVEFMLLYLKFNILIENILNIIIELDLG